MTQNNAQSMFQETHQRLDSNSKVPLYQQLFVILRAQIQSGDLQAGARVPGEIDLCKIFGVSRITARRALSELALAGLVHRQRGSGTRVSSSIAPAPLKASIDGLLESVEHIGRTTSVQVLAFGYVTTPMDIAKQLALAPHQQVLRALRVRMLGDQPMCYLTTWVPDDIGALIETQDTSQTPLLLLLERAGVPVASATQTITATLADTAAAGALKIPAGAPLIDVRRVVFDRSDRPVEVIKILFRPELYQFEMSMRRVQGAHGKAWRSDPMNET
ncbi:MAG: GntR family transcriptional regulator [Sedimentitalea sp.]